jgi:hypothetical protein
MYVRPRGMCAQKTKSDALFEGPPDGMCSVGHKKCRTFCILHFLSCRKCRKCTLFLLLALCKKCMQKVQKGPVGDPTFFLRVLGARALPDNPSCPRPTTTMPVSATCFHGSPTRSGGGRAKYAWKSWAEEEETAAEGGRG